jgi:hypothetical protein
MARIVAAIAALSVATSGAAQSVPAMPAAPQPEVEVVAPAPPESHPDAVVVPRDTMVRLMVLNEVNTRKAKPGDRFVLRVDENVAVNGTIVIPVGARAWGEVTDSRKNGAVGKAGQISARLLYVEAGGRQIPLSGEDRSKGAKGGDRVALAMVGFGIFGLLAEGAQGKLKAGHIFNGYLAGDQFYDPRASAFLEAGSPPPSQTASQ